MFVRMLRALSVLAVVTAASDDVISLNNDVIARDMFPDDVISLNNDVIARDVFPDDVISQNNDVIARDVFLDDVISHINDVIARDVFPDDVISLNNDVIARDVFPDIGEYFYIGVTANWTEALLLCQSSNANLTVIDSTAEAEAIKQMMTKYGASFIHVGFSDQFIEGKYNDILGEPIDAACKTGNEWAPGSPRGGSEFNCGGFSDAGFTDTRCGDKQVFICEIPTPSTEVTLPDYTVVPGHGLYKLHETWASWTEAAQICRDEGTHLLIINSQEEIDALMAAGIMYLDESFLVGVHRVYGGNNIFLTVLGGTLEGTGFSKWQDGEPFGTFITYPYVYYETKTFSGVNGLTVYRFNTVYVCEKEL